jgi:phage FluMu gp28-like protein
MSVTSLKLSEESRGRLVEHILESESNALELYMEEPSLVSEAVKDENLLQRLSGDPVLFSILILGYQPTDYQKELLRCSSKRILVRWPRQSGKTRGLAIFAIWFSAFYARTTTLIVGPSRRQSMIVGDLIHEYIDGIPDKIRRALVRKKLRTTVYFKNGSRIVMLPNSENLLRGYTSHLIIVDEAAFFDNDESIFQHVLMPMLATTDGTMIVSSTPWGKKTLFYRFNMDDDWTKLHITWREAKRAGVYKGEFLKEIEKTRKTLPLTYRMEYEAEFVEDVDTWLTQDLLAKVCRGVLEYIPFGKKAKGRLYLGADLGERVDHSVVAAVQKEGGDINLIHMHRFPLGTSLASVIGYMKTLRDRWNSIHAVYVDNTKHGDYIIQDFHDAGIPETKGITFTQNSKQEMAQLLKQRMAEGAFHMPYDRSLLDELNVEKYELTKTGKITLTHPQGTHDDRFWALALAVYAAEKAPPPPSTPIARTI